jgi:general secretion pathway protein G
MAAQGAEMMMQVTSAGGQPTGRPLSGFPHEALPGAQRAFTLFELLLIVAIIGILGAIAVPSYQHYLDQVKFVQAKADIVVIESAIERYYIQHSAYPDTLAEAGVGGMLDPWGHPYQYLNIATAKNRGSVRKDRNLVPINSDYDLYSMGKDGESKLPLTAKVSRDDIVRANNGQFVGLAADY